MQVRVYNRFVKILKERADVLLIYERKWLNIEKMEGV
jgi:hypothetical protein